MSTLVLGPILRHVTATTATVWFELSDPCTVEVLGASASTFTVHGHHYALVVVRGLQPASTTGYDVRIDGRVVWPDAASDLPPPSIRTLHESALTIAFGSCRAAAPHEPPYSLPPGSGPDSRGVDALWALGLRMLRTAPDTWPDVMVMLGDQVYADDPSPRVRHLLRRRRSGREVEPPEDVVRGFDEYVALYHEAWSPSIERWMLSVVPSTMVFDDHDMIDDWNISDRWVRDIRREPWWQEHIVGGLMSYWVYQHLGNLSPDRIEEEGLLAQLCAVPDGTAILRDWAMRSEEFTPVPGGYQFSYHRDLGDVRLVVVDNRNGRVLDPASRDMLDEHEWDFVEEHVLAPVRHVVVASSLPMLVPGALHDLQLWNEAVCAGRWGRGAGWVGERIRRSLDLEDWAAFQRSFRHLCELLGDAGRGAGGRAPATITLLSGDIHFAYVADARFPARSDVSARITQVVSSPMRNSLSGRERRVIRFALSRVGRSIGRNLRRLVRGGPTPLVWELSDGPLFENNVGTLRFDGDEARLTVACARSGDGVDGRLDVVIDRSL